jgi:hypothetical protein
MTARLLNAIDEFSWTTWLHRHRNLLTGLLLMLAAWLIYLPSVNYGFVYYDDVRILLNHPELYGQGKLSADLHAIFVTGFPREEPLLLRDVSWALDSRIFGFGNAFGYHLVNVLLHGIVVALMFAFLLGTTRRYGFALTVSIAWLVLAIHVEPVAWIMGRKDILSALFMLLALCAQTRRLNTENIRAACAWYLITLICFVCGLFSKISVLTFPLVLFLHAVFLPYLRNERQPNAPFLWGHALVKEIFLLMPSLVVSGLVYRWYNRTLTQMGLFDRGYTAHGLGHFWNLLMVDPLAFWVYARQIFFPWHLQLLYNWPALQSAYPFWQITVSLATVAAAGAIGIWLFRKHKDMFFYYGAFFLLMVPYLNLQYIGIWVAERYLYSSAFCILALALSLAAAISRHGNQLSRIIVLTVGVIFLAVNLFQKLSYQPAWRNGETLWQYHLSLPQPDPGAYSNLAAYYYADAVAHLGTPEMAPPMHKMAVVVDAGLAEFWRDRQRPPPQETYYLFFLQSIVQEVNGQPEAALSSLLTADHLHPGFDAINLNMARLYRKLAGSAQDSRQRETYERAARDRFAEYIALAFQGRPVPLEIHKEMGDIEAEYSAVTKAASNGETRPLPQ